MRKEKRTERARRCETMNIHDLRGVGIFWVLADSVPTSMSHNLSCEVYLGK